MIAIPYLEQGQEVGVRVLEGSMGLIGLKRFVRGSFPGVLNAQGCGNHGGFLNTALPARLNHHAGDSWVQRNSGHELALGGKFMVLPLPCHGTELQEHVKSVFDASISRRVQKRKKRRAPQPQIEHAKDDFRKVRTLDFRQGEKRPRFIVLFREEPDAHPVLNSPAAAFSLVGTAPRDGFDGQACGAGSRQVAGKASEARIDDISDSGDGEGCLGHIGGHNDFIALNGVNPALFGGRKPGKKRDDLGVRISAAFEALAGFKDVLFRRHKNKNVPEPLFEAKRIHRPDRHVHIGCFALVFQDRVNGEVLYLNRVQSA